MWTRLAPVSLFIALWLLNSVSAVLLGQTPTFKVMSKTPSVSSLVATQGSGFFDICIQDESNGNTLQLNSVTGDYQFDATTDGLNLNGKGAVSVKGCTIFLQHNASDRRLVAQVDSCSKRATATIQLFSLGRTLSIIDRDTTNNFCLSISNSIGVPKANPDAIFVHEVTLVTVTVQVAVDPNFLPNSVRLIRFARNIQELGTLFDDATHGDALKGDGTFTGQFSFNEGLVGSVELAATASYTNPARTVRSKISTIDLLRRPSDSELQATNLIQQQAAELFESDRNQMGDDLARAAVVNFLRGQSVVADAGIAQDSRTIWAKYTSGISSIIIGNPGNTQGGASTSRRSVDRQLPSNTVQKPGGNPQTVLPVTPIVAQTDVTLTGTGRAIVLSPFFDSFSPFDASDHIAQAISQTCAGPVQPVKNGDVTVNLMKSLNQYGVIFINTHGGLDGNGQVAILTRERSTFLNDIAHLIDLLTGRIEEASVGGISYFAITPAFIQHYAGGGYPKSLVFASACHTLDNATLSNAFLNNGAGTYFGWENTVFTDFNLQIGKSLFDVLTNTSLDAKDRTAGKAFDGLGNRTDPTPPHAVLMMAGNRDLAILDNPVLNGGFETGDLSAWTRDAAIGYTTASIDDRTVGNYSARIGRWDQPYMQGGCFRCGPVPGAEPSGQDFIYQDVMLPDGTPVLTLTFDYNVVTYDGADYDWFDMKVLDVGTGALLAQPVNHVGGNIAGCTCNWGLFYTTNWRHVTADLTPYRGRRVRLFFGVTQDGFGDQIAVYIDEVAVKCR